MRVTQQYTAKMHFKLASKSLVLMIAGTAFSLSAMAQWQWIDKDGRKVFSDRSPPADIQEKNILKRPAGSVRPTAQPAADETMAKPAPAGSAPLAKASAPKLTGKDAELEAKKKQAEDQEAAAKKAQEDKIAKARAENCDRAKSGMATLKSGVRMVGTNAKGEQEVFDDARRAAETKRVQEIIDSNCK
ncbi:MAG: hypothetical protein JWP47_2267 [Polaromonas sp.]|nr:hypothetical protein [Polaromonas sp.]